MSLLVFRNWLCFLQMGIRVSFQLLTLSANSVGKATLSCANAQAMVGVQIVESLRLKGQQQLLRYILS
jgi:hypothetical protein